MRGIDWVRSLRRALVCCDLAFYQAESDAPQHMRGVAFAQRRRWGHGVVTMKRVPALRPKTSGAYIWEAVAGRVWKVPVIVARAR